MNRTLISFVSIFSFLFLFSCESNDKGFSKPITDKNTYFEFREEVQQTEEYFKEKIIDEKEYALKMENYGDVFVKNVETIPPERRYRMSIYCYEEALKYNKNDKELRKKLHEQKQIFQVVEQ